MRMKPVALVTGSSRGIGRAVAIDLSRSGYRLILTARDKKALKETGRSCDGGDVVILPMDCLRRIRRNDWPTP
jgi:short-subunit dehydrogenase